jgi:low affinity Fe/Cu permease
MEMAKAFELHRVSSVEGRLRQLFRVYANIIADKVGSPAAFGFGLLVVIIWAVTGPIYHYSDTWQLVINSTSSVVTFLMVFLIQSTQNRDAQTMQMKLNELIRVSTARNIMVDLENCSEEEIKEIRAEFTNIRARISAKKESNKN